MHCPLDTHFEAVERILRYLKGTLTHGMTLKRSSHYLVGFSYVDWVSDSDDRRSMTGYWIFLGLSKRNKRYLVQAHKLSIEVLLIPLRR